MEVIIWVMCGVAAGSVAKVLMPGPNAGGIPVAILVGLAGGLMGGWLGKLTASNTPGAFDLRSLLMAFAATLILLFGYRCLAMRSNAQERLEYQS
jgi:uncharacterized membrane protein YeaQ/YmgE (transglycosylase-associated protein family)